MTRLFCIRDECGVPDGCRLMGRRFADPRKAVHEARRLLGTGLWSRIVHLDADDRLVVQFAAWAASLIGVNPRYVLSPPALIGYLRGPNWDEPDVGYAHYEQRVRGYGEELWREFSAWRSLLDGEAVRRMARLLRATGLKPAGEP